MHTINKTYYSKYVSDMHHVTVVDIVVATIVSIAMFILWGLWVPIVVASVLITAKWYNIKMVGTTQRPAIMLEYDIAKVRLLVWLFMSIAITCIIQLLYDCTNISDATCLIGIIIARIVIYIIDFRLGDGQYTIN